MPSATPTPPWAQAAPEPWKLPRNARPADVLYQSLSQFPLEHTLANTLPIATEVAIDGRWHHLPEEPPTSDEKDEKDEKASRSGAPINAAASRRAARLARDAARTQAAEQQKQREQQREPIGSDALWAERKAKILSLLGEEDASVAELKRELRRLLSYADAARSAAKEERAVLAAELATMLSPLVKEMRMLKVKVAKAEGADAKAAEALSPEAVDESAAVEDTLRAGKPGVGGEAEPDGPRHPPAMAPPPMKVVAKETSVAVTADGLAATSDGGGLSRRERQGAMRRAQAATSNAARGGHVQPLVAMIAEGGEAALAAAEALDALLIALGVDGTPLKRRLREAGVEAALLAQLSGADLAPSALHRAVLHALESYAEGWPAGCVALRTAGVASKLHALLRTWSAKVVQAARAAADAVANGAAHKGDADNKAPPPPPGAALLLPQLLLLITTLCEASDEARVGLVRAGFVETLLMLLDGDPTAEPTVLAVHALKALGVSNLKLLCADSPERLAAIHAVWALDRLFSAVSRRRQSEKEKAKARPKAEGAAGGGTALGTALPGRQKLLERRDERRKRPATEGAGAASVADGAAATSLVTATVPRLLQGDEANVLCVRLHAEGLRALADAVRALPGGQTLGKIYSSRHFVVVSVELRWGALVEIGRTQPSAVEAGSIWWDEQRFPLPDGVPPTVFVRFALYEWHKMPKPHRLVGVSGASVEQLQPGDWRSRGVPLALRATPPPSSSSAAGHEMMASTRGTLWVERCELVLSREDLRPPDEDEDEV